MTNFSDVYSLIDVDLVEDKLFLLVEDLNTREYGMISFPEIDSIAKDLLERGFDKYFVIETLVLKLLNGTFQVILYKPYRPIKWSKN